MLLRFLALYVLYPLIARIRTIRFRGHIPYAYVVIPGIVILNKDQ